MLETTLESKTQQNGVDYNTTQEWVNQIINNLNNLSDNDMENDKSSLAELKNKLDQQMNADFLCNLVDYYIDNPNNIDAFQQSIN